MYVISLATSRSNILTFSMFTKYLERLRHRFSRVRTQQDTFDNSKNKSSRILHGWDKQLRYKSESIHTNT